MLSDALGGMIRLRLSTNAIRTIEHKGGLDAFLLDAKDAQLSLEARRIKRRIAAKIEKLQAAEPPEPSPDGGKFDGLKPDPR